jgi:MarR family transcriptional regulator for hemolysin
MVTKSAPDPRREFVAQLMETARHLRYYVDRRAREHGTTRAQWLALFRLCEREGMSQVDLAQILDLKPISLVPILDKLVEQGLVKRRRNPKDRRANRLYLTEAGRTAVADLDFLRDDIAWQVLGDAEDTSVAVALALLQQVKDRIKTEPSELPDAGTKAAPLDRRSQLISDPADPAAARSRVFSR